MLFLLKLALSTFTVRKIRTALTLLAIAFSVALVVATTSGYSSVEASAFRFLDQMLGQTDVVVERDNDTRGGVEESIAELLRADPDVAILTARFQHVSMVNDKAGKVRIDKTPMARIVGVKRPGDNRVEALRIRDGAWFETSDGNFAVIDQVLSEKRELKVGDAFSLPGPRGPLPLTVVGIIHKPEFFASAMQQVYVPLQTLQEFIQPGERRQLTKIDVDLVSGADVGAFVKRWETRLRAIDPTIRVKPSGDTKAEMERNLAGVGVMSFLGGTVAMVAATFIVFSTLSMGVAERQRTLAMLRAVGAMRWQVGTLVVVEAIFLALAGAAIGVPLGMLAVGSLAWWYPNVFAAGAVANWTGIAWGAGGTLVSAVVASFLPAWSAMRVSPLEAMSPLAGRPSMRLPILMGVFGVILIGVDSLLMFAPIEHALKPQSGLPLDQAVRQTRFYGHILIGLPALMLGFFLVSPLFVWGVERLFGPALARVMRLNPTMLRQQLSGGIWRSAGTATALMVGLSILTLMQTQGNTLLKSWELPDRFPDIFVVAPGLMGGLDQDAQARLAATPGILPGKLLPIAVASPELGNGFFSIIGAAVMPDATMFFGIDPDLAFDMLQLDFRDAEGRSVNPEERRKLADAARLKLKLGRHVIVTDEFRQLKGLAVGDALELKTSKAGLVKYTIAGIVWSPGMDVINHIFDMDGQLDRRTAASVFGTVEDARNDFGVDRISFFGAMVDPGAQREDLLKKIQESVGAMNLKAFDVRQVKHNVQKAFGNLLMLASTIAFAAMGVSSLGVTNTIMASIRSRRWQFGILRSIGLTRGHLLRLVMAEAILLAIVGCAMGLSAGLLMSFNAKALMVHMSGYNPPTVIPWDMLGIGTAIVVAIALLASFWPAWNVARSEPLSLLQAGRAAG